MARTAHMLQLNYDIDPSSLVVLEDFKAHIVKNVGCRIPDDVLFSWREDNRDLHLLIRLQYA